MTQPKAPSDEERAREWLEESGLCYFGEFSEESGKKFVASLAAIIAQVRAEAEKEMRAEALSELRACADGFEHNYPEEAKSIRIAAARVAALPTRAHATEKTGEGR